MSGSLLAITPLVPVTDLDDAVAFFEGTLGFAVQARMDGYAYVTRDQVALRLITTPGVDLGDAARQMSCYIDVADVDALYERLRPALSGLPAGRVRPPFNQDYGQREFHVRYEALVIFFGAAITVIP